MTRRNSGTAEVLLGELADGPLPKTELVARAKPLAGSRMALSRLLRRGLVIVEYRLTPEGEKALEGKA